MITCQNKMKDELKNLIVVNEMFSRNLKSSNKDFTNQSFQLEL